MTMMNCIAYVSVTKVRFIDATLSVHAQPSDIA